jgi:hypothetical protein
MAEVEFPKRVPTPRELDSRSIRDDYRPKQLRLSPVAHGDAERAAEDEFAPLDDGNALPKRSDILRKLEVELGRRPLDEIARLIRSLTYGEMIELASSVSKVQPEGSVIAADNLPDMLYRWSTGRLD